MYRRRLIVGSGFLTLFFSAFYLAGQPNTVKKITDGVWFREGDLEHEGHCNNIIIEMKDYLVVIDANFPSGARKALADARKLSKKPVKYVFDTHHHGDHAYGNAVWTKEGATTIAHAGVVEELKAREPAAWLSAAKSRPDVAELKRGTAEPPQQTFTKSPHVISDGTRKIELHHFGWAHTKGDGFAYLPNEKIICTGDAATNGPYNFTAQGHIGNWPKVLQGAMKLDVKTVLPGHGPAGGREVLEGEALFMTELMKAVKAARGQGKKLGDLVTMKNGQASATAMKLPDAVKTWVGKPLPSQVYDAWMELEKGAPRGSF
jgi:glyoxylase-like metal-dependent hydrolase (beta-lactamase superfamily II)